MNVEHEPREALANEKPQKDFSAIENPNLRGFLEEFLRCSPVPLESSIKVGDAVKASFGLLNEHSVDNKLSLLPKPQLETAGKKLSAFLQREYILRFDPMMKRIGASDFKMVKGDSLLALAAICHQYTETEFLIESRIQGLYPYINKAQLLERVEELHKTGVFEGALRSQDVPLSVWQSDYKKRALDLQDELESRRQNKFSSLEDLIDLEADSVKDDDIAFINPVGSERIIFQRISKGITDGKYSEWTTEKLQNLDEAEYHDPLHAIAPMTEDVYFMIKTIVAKASKSAGDEYNFARPQNEITYREYRALLERVSFVMQMTERDLIFHRIMSKEDRGTLLLSDVFRHVWRQLPGGELDFPRQSS